MIFRSDNRAPEQVRPVNIIPDFISTAEGSALIEMGNTRVICTASVEETVPAFMRNSGKGWISGEYGMLPRSTLTRSAREAAKGKQSGRTLGPGLVTGASDDDPSGIGTYSVAGAKFGYATLWTALLTFPLMAAIQLICARIALASGKGIATVMREHYPRPLVLIVVAALLIANTINVGADILAIAAGVNLLVPVPIRLLIVPIGLLILALQIWGSYRLIAGVFKWLCLSLLGYIGASLLAKLMSGGGM